MPFSTALLRHSRRALRSPASVLSSGSFVKAALICFFLILTFLEPLGGTLRADPPNLGPLFHNFELTLDRGERTEAVGPLFYDDRQEEQRTWAFPPLLSYTVAPGLALKEFNFLYPVMTYDRYGDQYRWQFFQILSLSGCPTQTDERHRFTLFPLYFQQRSSDPSQNYTAVVPFYGTIRKHLFRDEINFVMFPLYSQTKKKDVVTDNYLYPVFHLRHGDGLEGWQFWPLVGREHKDVTTKTNGFNDVQTVPGHDSFFMLWPIFFNDHKSVGTPNISWELGVLPFYNIERSALRDRTTVIWPFFNHIEDRDKKYVEWDTPWPLIEFARGEGKTTSRVWPFFSQSHSKILENNFYLWPIYKYNRANLPPLDRRRSRIVFFLYSDTIDRNTETGLFNRRTYLWPFFIHRHDFNGNTRLQVLALL